MSRSTGDNAPSVDVNASRVAGATCIAQAAHLPEAASTNDLAVAVANGEAVGQLSDPMLPLLIIADRQTAGRGRGAKHWWTGPKCLAFSVLLDAQQQAIDPRRQSPEIATAAGRAVVDAVRQQLPDIAHRVKPRWPNDVYADDRKLAGVLIEVPRPNRLVIGIGLNVNARAAEAPPELADSITTVRDLCGHEVDRQALLIAILQSLEQRLGEISSHAERNQRR